MSTFDAAVLAFFGLKGDFTVETEIQGAQEVQLGDYTWDTDPGFVEVRVYERVRTEWGEQLGGLVDSRRFSSLPELWDALHSE